MKELEPVRRDLGREKMLIEGRQAAVVFTDTSARQSMTVWLPGLSLCFDGPAPAKLGTIYQAEATGRTRLVPLWVDSSLLWRPLKLVPGGEYACNLDVVGDISTHLWEPARVERAPDGRVVRITTSHRGIPAYSWEFHGRVTCGGQALPRSIRRTRYKASGLTIPKDDTVEWTLRSLHPYQPPRLSPNLLLMRNAMIQDSRDFENLREFRFDPASSLEAQAHASTAVARQGRGSSPIVTLLGTLASFIVGSLGASLNMRRSE